MKELPYHLKDLHGLNWRLEPDDAEKPEKVKLLIVQFDIEHARLQKAMALVYDQVYDSSELDFEQMRLKVRALHEALIDEGYSLTDIKKAN